MVIPMPVEVCRGPVAQLCQSRRLSHPCCFEKLQVKSVCVFWQELFLRVLPTGVVKINQGNITEESSLGNKLWNDFKFSKILMLPWDSQAGTSQHTLPMANEGWKSVFLTRSICISWDYEAWTVFTWLTRELEMWDYGTEKKWGRWAQTSRYHFIHPSGSMHEEESLLAAAQYCACSGILLLDFEQQYHFEQQYQYIVDLLGQVFASQGVTHLFFSWCRNPLLISLVMSGKLAPV